ncbi:Wadjet anti-phage system protein JetD domain-containing protein [Nocardioides donggukensis]|uniref:Wadjet protein JetD C-terminal domain-containing protein n=1 Tax=Nocardioides donggukensis TaxID=2774019 RepID=A0A927Q2Q5_9ACTN|nr:DUF3322 and DUF2220 domain-containing protein [Nocardioides donggukensis]MBD8870614.1 hypothetical protein [Nocardioides donggukensis]
MKTPEQVRAAIATRLGNNWHTDTTCETVSWPHTFPLGQPTKTDLEANYGDFHRRKVALQDWAQGHGASLTYANRVVLGTTQPVPTHVTVPDITTAATIAAGEWPHRLRRATARLAMIRDRFPHTADPARLLRGVDGYTDTDFTLLLDAADWLTRNDPTGLTPRQVPVPGLHAKWLNSHGRELLALTCRDNLGLLPRHPARIHFTYLDPAHRAAGGRVHDSATVDDPFTPAYQPQVVVISENKDTAIHFPPIPGGIAVEGDGFGGKTVAKFPWLISAPRLYYWGDIDAHGYEILNGWRADGVPVKSILMDPATYDTYEPFGTNTDKNNKPLGPGTPKPLPFLTDDERTVYELVLAYDHQGHRRVEQERIPLRVALGLVGGRP